MQFVWQQNALLHIVCHIDFYGLYILQTYAPTTLATARDFWTLRYTTGLEDGSLVVCYVIALLFLSLIFGCFWSKFVFLIFKNWVFTVYLVDANIMLVISFT